MLQIKVKNEYSETLDFSGNTNYIITNVTGITPPGANLNFSDVATKDGSVFNSSRVSNRNIVLTILPQGNVEANRVNLYNFFKTKKAVTLYFKTASREVYINGYVETMETALYSQKEEIQVSIICPDPYLLDVDATSENMGTSETIGTFAPENEGDDNVGFVIDLSFNGTVNGVKIMNNTFEYIGVNAEFEQYDVLRISTVRGEKGIWKLRNLTKTNLINYLDLNSQWLQLSVGINDLSVILTDGSISNVEGVLTFRNVYEGV